MNIKIQNPLPGGASHVGLKRAERHVKRGIAEWMDPATKLAIRFVESHHRRRAAESNSGKRLAKQIAELKRTAADYDIASDQGIATDKQLAGVPIVKPREMIAPRGRLIPRPKYMRAADVNHVPTPQRASA